MKKKKAQVSIYLVWFFMAIVIVTIASVLAPLGVRFNTEMYKMGEMIILDANESLSGIQNESIRNEIQGVLNTALEAEQNNIEVNANIFQYSWVFVILLSAVVMFLYSRRINEIGGGFI